MDKSVLPPVPTQPLRAAYENRCLIPWVGAGLSKAILGLKSSEQLPGFRAVIERLASEAHKANFIEHADISSVSTALDHAEYEKAASIVRSQLPNGVFSQFMWDQLSTVRPRSSQHHLMLNLMQFPIYLTTNYDWVLDDIVRPRPKVLSYRDHKTLAAIVNNDARIPGDSPFIFKLNGDLSTPSSIVLGQSKEIGLYDPETQLGAGLRATLKKVMSSHSILFLGYSFEAKGYRRMLMEIGDELGESCRSHFAILPTIEAANVAEREDLKTRANVTFFEFDLLERPKIKKNKSAEEDFDRYAALWQFLSQIPDRAPDREAALAPEAVTRSFFRVSRRADYLAMQNNFETKSTGFRFLTPTLTNAIATPAFLEEKTPATLVEFRNKEGIDDWEAWKDDVIGGMKARAGTFLDRMNNGAEARILCRRKETLGAIAKASESGDSATLKRYRLCLNLFDVKQQDIEIRFMEDTVETRSLMSYASLIRLNPNRSADIGVAYAAQATTSEFDAHVFEMNTEFSREMLVIFEREWARSISLDESMSELRNVLQLAETGLDA